VSDSHTRRYDSAHAALWDESHDELHATRRAARLRPIRPVVNPRAQLSNLLGTERVAFRRHSLGSVGCRDSSQQFALGTIAWNHGFGETFHNKNCMNMISRRQLLPATCPASEFGRIASVSPNLDS
jgi:uncharacterized protein (DUF58 family)